MGFMREGISAQDVIAVYSEAHKEIQAKYGLTNYDIVYRSYPHAEVVAIAENRLDELAEEGKGEV